MKTEKVQIQALQNQIDVLTRKLEAFESNEKMFHALVETAVGDIGEDFFNNIVKKLSEWLNAECIIIGQLVADNVVQGFPMYLDGEIVHGFTYHLKDTPCDLTTKKGYCEYTDNVRSIFPTSKDLIDLNARGYLGTALYNKNGEPNGVLCAISRNRLQLPPQAEEIMRIVGARISAEIDRIKTYKALEISEEKLRNANASKDKFFSIVAHDLKSPFNTLIGFSEILISDIQKNKFTKIENYAQIIHDVANQTFELLNNLLEWSSSQTGMITYNPEKFNFIQLADNIIGSFKSLCIPKLISISSALPSGLEMSGDKSMISIVLRNLISNAIKYTKEGGEITISADVKNDEITISVTDNGIGITPENLNKLFNLSETISTNGTCNEKGTGLGLILCKEFIEKHNGRIWAESEVDKGSVFSFSIPVH